MSQEAETEEEPSIEEILDSIRQIISEDEDEQPSPNESLEQDTSDEGNGPLDQGAIDDMDFDSPAEVAEEPVETEPLDQGAIDDMNFDSQADDDVLELTDIIKEPSLESADKAEGHSEESTPSPEVMEEEIEVSFSEPEEESEIEEPEPIEPVVEDDIKKDTEISASQSHDVDSGLLTQSAEDAAVSAVASLVRKTAVEHNGVTLEEIVRSELKPMLKDWLDRNLPILIERLVAQELERVSKRVLEDDL